jgi:hypothetical protein
MALERAPEQFYTFQALEDRHDTNSKGLAKILNMPDSIYSAIKWKHPIEPKGYQNRSTYRNFGRFVEGVCDAYARGELMCSCEDMEPILRSGTLSGEEMNSLRSRLLDSIPRICWLLPKQAINQAEKSVSRLERFLRIEVKPRFNPRSSSIDAEALALASKEISKIKEMLAQLRQHMDQHLTWQLSDEWVVSQAEVSIMRLEDFVGVAVKSRFDPRLSSIDAELLFSLSKDISSIKQALAHLRYHINL